MERPLWSVGEKVKIARRSHEPLQALDGVPHLRPVDASHLPHRLREDVERVIGVTAEGARLLVEARHVLRLVGSQELLLRVSPRGALSATRILPQGKMIPSAALPAAVT